MHKILLNDGHQIPQIGYGTWMIKPADAKMQILQAFKSGYKHIDTAQIYNNEYEIGLALAELQAKGLKRTEFFLTTKVWLPNFNSEQTFLTSIKQSLTRLKVAYVDLVLLHWPVKGKNVQAYKWLEKAKDLGWTKSIGVSNFMINHLEAILKIAKHKPVVNQIEIQPLVQQNALVDFCKNNNIVVTGYSNLKSYLNHEMNTDETNLLESIAQSIGKTVPEIILRWVYQRGIVIIPKSSSVERMQLNLSITDFQLTDNQMAQIKQLDRNNYTKADDIYDGKLWAKETLLLKDFLFDKHFKP